MSDYFDGKYEIDDGYAGASRPQYFRVRLSDLSDDMTDEDLRQFYEQEADDHFRLNTVITTLRLDDFVAWAREQLKAARDE